MLPGFVFGYKLLIHTSASTGDAVADLEYLLDRSTDHVLLPDYMLKLAPLSLLSVSCASKTLFPVWPQLLHCDTCLQSFLYYLQGK